MLALIRRCVLFAHQRGRAYAQKSVHTSPTEVTLRMTPVGWPAMHARPAAATTAAAAAATRPDNLYHGRPFPHAHAGK